MIPVAAGCAFAPKKHGSDRIAINFIGEGGTSTGEFHEALNLAAVWKLPLVLVIENNRYAFSTPARYQYACILLSDRGQHRTRVWQWFRQGRCIMRTMIDEQQVTDHEREA